MAFVRDYVLDSNLIAHICLATPEQQGAAHSRMNVARKKGARFLLSPTGLSELAASYKNAAKFERLISTAHEFCDGILPFGSEELVQIEIGQADPYTVATRTPPLPKDKILETREAVSTAEIEAFHAAGGFGYDSLKHLLEALDPVGKKYKDEIPGPFAVYAKMRLRTAMESLLAISRDRKHIKLDPQDFDQFFKRARAWHFVTLVLVANEYRRLTRTQYKGEGSLSDLRHCIEGAYCHQIWTADRELSECGRMANHLESKPTFVYWNPRA